MRGRLLRVRDQEVRAEADHKTRTKTVADLGRLSRRVQVTGDKPKCLGTCVRGCDLKSSVRFRIRVCVTRIRRPLPPSPTPPTPPRPGYSAASSALPKMGRGLKALSLRLLYRPHKLYLDLVGLLRPRLLLDLLPHSGPQGPPGSTVPAPPPRPSPSRHTGSRTSGSPRGLLDSQRAGLCPLARPASTGIHTPETPRASTSSVGIGVQSRRGSLDFSLSLARAPAKELDNLNSHRPSPTALAHNPSAPDENDPQGIHVRFTPPKGKLRS